MHTKGMSNKMNKNIKAKKRIAELKGFYTHLMVYIFINIMLVVVKIVGTTYNGESFMGPLWHFSTFLTPLAWGLGLAFHAIKVFRINPFFNKDWEERQIRKFMEEDRKEVEKYKQLDDGHGEKNL